MNKFSKIINNLRIVPRLMIIMYGYIFYKVTQWFMLLTIPTMEQSTFVAVIVGSAAAFFGLYVNSGGDTDE